MITVFIPIYNEEVLLEPSAKRVHEYLTEKQIEHEIIVVSNGSTDGSNEIGQRLARETTWLRFFELTERGPGRAFVLGVKEARGESIVTLDIDLSSDINFLDYAITLLKHGAMVVGSKTMGEQRRSLFRLLGSQAYIFVSQAAFDLTISDFSIGCKALRRSEILAALPHLDHWTGYIFELALYLKTRGRKILQVSIDCNDKRKSRFNLFHEASHRYLHLYRCWRLLKRKDSWLHAT